jgi:hypothetical protein
MLSISPWASRTGSCCANPENAANLTLDEPALMTRTTSVMQAARVGI